MRVFNYLVLLLESLLSPIKSPPFNLKRNLLDLALANGVADGRKKALFHYLTPFNSSPLYTKILAKYTGDARQTIYGINLDAAAAARGRSSHHISPTSEKKGATQFVA